MSTPAPSPLHRVTHWLDRRKLRERLLVFITSVVAMYFLTSLVLFMPQEKELSKLRSDMVHKRAELEPLLLEIQTLGAQLSEDPDAATRLRLEEMQQALRDLEAPLAELTRGLVRPREMAGLVERIVRSQPKLQVINIKNLPPDVLQTMADSESVGEVALYRHGLRVVVRGGYRDLVAFFSALESLPWKVLWSEVDMHTERYPTSTATLTLYTLSTERAWLGL